MASDSVITRQPEDAGPDGWATIERYGLLQVPTLACNSRELPGNDANGSSRMLVGPFEHERC